QLLLHLGGATPQEVARVGRGLVEQQGHGLGLLRLGDEHGVAAQHDGLVLHLVAVDPGEDLGQPGVGHAVGHPVEEVEVAGPLEGLVLGVDHADALGPPPPPSPTHGRPGPGGGSRGAVLETPGAGWTEGDGEGLCQAPFRVLASEPGRLPHVLRRAPKVVSRIIMTMMGFVKRLVCAKHCSKRWDPSLAGPHTSSPAMDPADGLLKSFPE
uniref:Uncharacterized protein n=1 Tax=Ornithorhynchus anatinus TaxID=9258 RepID=A0A6I8PFD3_ORNAN